ncbi:MAG: DUF3467 domain-containing protein [Candidatus Wukongarchaeota archaeon]|jgi:hypothetical protein|nr:DUF3467 domain-containing protein [Candidatus Wukongarchaeota archaeon]
MSEFTTKIQVSKNADFKQVYATGIQGGHTPFDFRIAFHNESVNLEESIPGEKIVIDRDFKVEVILSPFAAKKVMLWLKRHVEDYEEQYGEIKTQKPAEIEKVEYIT